MFYCLEEAGPPAGSVLSAWHLGCSRNIHLCLMQSKRRHAQCWRRNSSVPGQWSCIAPAPRLTLAVPASCALSVLKMPSWVGVLLSFLHTGNRGSVEQKVWSLRATNLGTGQAGLSFPRVASSLPHFWVPSLPCVTAVPSGHNCHQGDSIELLVRGQNPSRFPLAQSPWVSLGRLHLRNYIRV